jgi:galactonate dehydratase
MAQTTSRRNFFKNAVTFGALASPLATFGNGYEKAIGQANKMSNPADLKITQVKCGYIRNGHSLFVKIYTNQDIVGHGEGVDATPGTYHLVKMFEAREKVLSM